MKEMEQMQEKLQELSALMGQRGPESEVRRKELTEWIAAHRTPENEVLIEGFVHEGISFGIASLTEIREQIRSQIEADKYKLLPIAYIARHYFGKSTSWLSQRINGTKVRGKSYTLNQQQKAVFNAAVQDIARQIGSVSIG